jgi:hypothetical protein
MLHTQTATITHHQQCHTLCTHQPSRIRLHPLNSWKRRQKTKTTIYIRRVKRSRSDRLPLQDRTKFRQRWRTTESWRVRTVDGVCGLMPSVAEMYSKSDSYNSCNACFDERMGGNVVGMYVPTKDSSAVCTLACPQVGVSQIWTRGLCTYSADISTCNSERFKRRTRENMLTDIDHTRKQYHLQ